MAASYPSVILQFFPTHCLYVHLELQAGINSGWTSIHISIINKLPIHNRVQENMVDRGTSQPKDSISAEERGGGDGFVSSNTQSIARLFLGKDYHFQIKISGQFIKLFTTSKCGERWR